MCRTASFKEILTFGKFAPVVSEQRESAAKPADAPLQLPKDEQDRITAQERAAKQELDIAESDLEVGRTSSERRSKLAGNCHTAYVKRTTVRAPSFQPGDARSRLRQGSEGRPSGVLGGLRAPLLAPGFE